MCGSCRSRLHRHRQPETFHQAPQEHQNPQRSPVVGTAGRDSQEGMTMPTEKRRIVVSLPARILKDVEWLAPLEDMTRDELILVAIKRFLKPHLDIRKQVLRAAANPGRLSAPFDTAEEFIARMGIHASRYAISRRRDARMGCMADQFLISTLPKTAAPLTKSRFRPGACGV